MYGYLVAISYIEETRKIYILEKNLPLILNLRISKKTKAKIVACKSQDELITNGDVIVIARRPIDQMNIIQNNIQLLKTKILLLEKPLAPSPNEAAKLLNILESEKIKFSVGFLFQYLHWPDLIFQQDGQRKEIEISWNLVDHGKLGWKKDQHGGGAVDLLGIHILAIMPLHNFSVTDSKVYLNKSGREDRWHARFKKKSLLVNLELNSDCEKNFFKISVGDVVIYQDQTPYGKEFSPGALDNRLGPLKTYIDSAISNQNSYKELELNRKIICLWEQVRSNYS